MPANQNACEENERLFERLTCALRCVIEMQGCQIAAVKLGDRKTGKFDQEIRVALQAWQDARSAYLQHVLDHGCRSSDDLT